MADENGSTGQESGTGTTQQGQAPAGQQQGNAQGQAPTQSTGTPAEGQQPNGTSSTDPDLSSITDPNLRAWVEAQAKAAREARQEAARYRTERNTLQQQHQQFVAQHETDEQRQQREQQERDERFRALEAENRTLKVAPQFTKAATDAKALDPSALLTLVGGLEAITLDEQGKATNLDALLADARQKYPYLFSRTTADAHQGNDAGGATAGAGMNDFIRGRVHAGR